MGRAVLQACLPWLALWMAMFLCGALLARLSGARLRPTRLRHLHADQSGAVQSLAFVLVLPFFVMIMLFIVQVSQVMIGTVVVHYAAFAAARSAVVWIPAGLASPEGANCLSAYFPDFEALDQAPPILDPTDPGYGPTEGGVTYLVAPGSPKFEKIASAAVLACVPISPSRNVGYDLAGPGAMGAAILQRAYLALVPDAADNPRIAQRLQNKLAYAAANTQIEIRFFHKNSEPPILTYLLSDDIGEFYFNEIGWQDPITVTVRHDMALLPGPGRLLARALPGPGGSTDEVSRRIRRQGDVYVYPLSASATLGNEGEKSVLPYEYFIY